MMTGKRLLISAIGLSLVQLGFLGWTIAGRAAILRSGTEVLLKIEPVDPRDLLRGDYVALQYDISTIPLEIVTNIPAGASEIDAGPVFVRLRKEADGNWRAVSATFDVPPSTPPTADEADIKGYVSDSWIQSGGAQIHPDYGIGRFYLPEGEGLAIQNDMRVRPFGMRVAIGKDGTAQIKALVDGDTTLFEEPLY
jgi:uncharacterized membrane-anchored protein